MKASTKASAGSSLLSIGLVTAIQTFMKWKILTPQIMRLESQKSYAGTKAAQ